MPKSPGSAAVLVSGKYRTVAQLGTGPAIGVAMPQAGDEIAAFHQPEPPSALVVWRRSVGGGPEGYPLGIAGKIAAAAEAPPHPVDIASWAEALLTAQRPGKASWR